MEFRIYLIDPEGTVYSGGSTDQFGSSDLKTALAQDPSIDTVQPPSQYKGVFDNSIKRLSSGGQQLDATLYAAGNQDYYYRPHVSIIHDKKAWSWKEINMPSIEHFKNLWAIEGSSIDNFNVGIDKRNFQCKGNAIIRTCEQSSSNTAYALGYYDNNPQDPRVIEFEISTVSYKDPKPNGKIISAMYTTLKWLWNGEYLTEWPQYWSDSEDDLYVSLYQPMQSPPGTNFNDFFPPLAPSEPWVAPYWAYFQPVDPNGDPVGSPARWTGVEAKACNEEGVCDEITIWARAFEIERSMSASISTVLQRAPTGDTYTTAPHSLNEKWTSIASADFVVDSDFGCFYLEENLLTPNGDEWIIILEPENIEVNWIDDFPNAYDAKINSQGEISFKFDNGTKCNDNRFSHSHFYVKPFSSNSSLSSVGEFRYYDTDPFRYNSFTGDIHSSNIVSGSSKKMKANWYMEQLEMTQAGYHGKKETPVLDEDGQVVVDSNGDTVYEYQYGVYFPPKYNALIRWEGFKFSTGKSELRQFSISGTLQEIKNAFNAEVQSFHASTNPGVTREEREAVNYFGLLIKPGDGIIIVPPIAGRETRISDPSDTQFHNRSKSRMLQSNRSITSTRGLDTRGLATRLEADEG